MTAPYSGCVSQALEPSVPEQPARPVIRCGEAAALQPAALAPPVLLAAVTAPYSGCVSQALEPSVPEQPARPVIRCGEAAALQPAALAIQLVGVTPPCPVRGCRLRCCLCVG